MGKKEIRDIEFGTVLDHIKPGYGTKVSDILKRRIWPDKIYTVYTGEGCTGKNKVKDIVKLDGMHLKMGDDVLNEIAIIQPDITVNLVENQEVTDKKQARDCIGNKIHTDLIYCGNTNCISYDEAPGTYEVLNKNPLEVCCRYCGRVFEAKYNGK